MHARKLYLGRRDSCPASFMAWLALREQGIDFDEQFAEPLQPDGVDGAWRRAPTLVEDDAWVIFDAAAIMEYASDLGGQSLVPGDPRARARVRSFVGWNRAAHATLCASATLENAFAGGGATLAPHEQREAFMLFAVIESQLLASRGPYLFGNLSLADIAFVPTLVRTLAAKADLGPWKSATRWAARMLHRRTVAEWTLAANARSAG